MSEGWLASLIPALFLLLLALFAYARSRSWLAPGTFFPMIWTGLVLLPLLGAPDYEVRAGAVWYILASNFAVYSGSLVGGAQ
jgi:hypothetical protein